MRTYLFFYRNKAKKLQLILCYTLTETKQKDCNYLYVILLYPRYLTKLRKKAPEHSCHSLNTGQLVKI